jgi:anaerobic dimethyl sulfoxide reductase subunit B (iron-sulfur subunit)
MTRQGNEISTTSPLGFFVDATRCINCKTCEVACKDANEAAVCQRLRRVHTFEGGEYPDLFVGNLSMSCNHCEEPQCLAACPAGAYSKRAEDGIVVHDPERCIGCQYCTWACPYAAPQYDAGAGKVKKCDLCVERIEAGMDPVCVQACLLRAIEVGRLEDIAARPGATIAIRNLPSPETSRPTTRYRVRRAMRLE